MHTSKLVNQTIQVGDALLKFEGGEDAVIQGIVGAVTDAGASHAGQAPVPVGNIRHIEMPLEVPQLF